MTAPKVSVLMPVYNGERYVAEAIESILAQTFADFEFIIVDDGSTDGTPSILAEYARQDPRIALLTNGANRGLVPTLNRGLKACRGEYIARMDADDISLPERLARQVTCMDQHPEVGVLGTNIAYIDSGGRLLNGGRPKDPEPMSPAMVHWSLLWHCAIYHPTVMVRRRVLEWTGFAYDPAFRHAEDRDLWTRLAPHTTIASLSEILVHYRILPTSVCRAHRGEQRARDRAITHRELTILLGHAPSDEALNTAARVFARDRLGPHRDFAGAAHLLLRAYWRFGQRPLSPADWRQIERDVARRLLVIGREAALHSPHAALQMLRRLRYLSLGALLAPETARGVTGVLLRMVGLRRPARPDGSRSAIGGTGD
ncbi:MAG TPA: glycosyltransferase [Anaerolineae bacterium]|nr:glycosyltransferase [Anaerolineae bacterium]